MAHRRNTTSKQLAPKQASELRQTLATPAAQRLLTIKDVAERLQLSPRTICRLIAAGELKAVHIGRSVRITEGAFNAFLTEGDST